MAASQGKQQRENSKARIEPLVFAVCCLLLSGASDVVLGRSSGRMELPAR